MKLVISSNIQHKLTHKHGVSRNEILECFANRVKGFLIDTRENHKTTPPTHWFIAETNYGRKLKVVFIPKGGKVIIRTAYEPNATECGMYSRKA